MSLFSNASKSDFVRNCKKSKFLMQKVNICSSTLSFDFLLEYVRRYASADVMNENEDNMSTSSESSLSDFSEDEAQDMEL